MRHIKRITEDTPSEAFVFQWWSQSKGQIGAYAAILFGQADNRTADYEDGDF